MNFRLVRTKVRGLGAALVIFYSWNKRSYLYFVVLCQSINWLIIGAAEAVPTAPVTICTPMQFTATHVPYWLMVTLWLFHLVAKQNWSRLKQ